MNLIATKEYLLLIDEEAEIKEKDWFYHPNQALVTQVEQAKEFTDNQGIEIINGFNGYVCQKILAYYPLTKEAKELDLPLLPNPFEEVITDIAEKYAWNCKNEFTTKVKANELVKASTRDFIAGYKAAQQFNKQYSLEDVKKAIKMARTLFEENMFDIEEILGLTEVNTHNMILKYSEEEIIQSLSTQQLPKEFIPEYEDYFDQDAEIGDDWGHKSIRKRLKTFTNSEGKQELVGTYKY